MQSPLTVLIVDEDSGLSSRLRGVFDNSELQPAICQTTTEAVALLDQQTFAALIVDVLPRQHALVRKFYACNPTSPAIFLSSAQDTARGHSRGRSRAELVIHKSLASSFLKKHVVEIIAAAKQVQEGRQANNAEAEEVLNLEDQTLNALLEGAVLSDETAVGPYLFSAIVPQDNKRQPVATFTSRQLQHHLLQAKHMSAIHYNNVCVVTTSVKVAGVHEGKDISGWYRSSRVYSKKNGQWQSSASPSSTYPA